jgi:hypothetical protein
MERHVVNFEGGEEEKKRSAHRSTPGEQRGPRRPDPRNPSGRVAAHGEVLEAVSKWAAPLLARQSWRWTTTYQAAYHAASMLSGRSER